MHQIVESLQQLVYDYEPMLKNISEQEFSAKPNPAKWSKKEILGHLIDSAQNNIRRFVVSRYEDQPFIVYAQDQWVTIANYQAYPSADLITLWKLLNIHAARILATARDADWQKTSRTNDPNPKTIAWLAEDYIKHLKHHMHQVLDLEPVAYP